MNDPLLAKCVVHLCGQNVAGDRMHPDFCRECIDLGVPDDHFGRCYMCQASEHVNCVGVPCHCGCDDMRATLVREQQRAAILAKLTPAERGILGV